jgi:hypothetical protein
MTHGYGFNISLLTLIFEDYDKKMRAELKWRAAELEQLIAGQDPYGRRQSTLERIKRWLHPN